MGGHRGKNKPNGDVANAAKGNGAATQAKAGETQNHTNNNRPNKNKKRGKPQKTAAELKKEAHAHLDPNADLDAVLAEYAVAAPVPKKGRAVKGGKQAKADVNGEQKAHEQAAVVPEAAAKAPETNENEVEGVKQKKIRKRRGKKKKQGELSKQDQAKAVTAKAKQRHPLDDLDENCSTPSSELIEGVPREAEDEGEEDGLEEEGARDSGTDEDFSDNDNERSKEYRKGGYHPVYVGEIYNNRYRVVHKLGWGYFSTVWLVWDYTTEKFFAMKVQKSAEHYRDAAFDEIKLLSQIMAGDPDGQMCCARMIDSFEHKGPHGLHVVMVFEILGENLLKLIERYENRGIPIPIVKSIARQMLIGLHHIHSINILHTDIKPENVLLSQPKHKIFRLMRKFKPPKRGEQHTPLLEKDLSMMTKSQRRRYHAKLRKMKHFGHEPPPGTGKDADPKAKPKCIQQDEDPPVVADSDSEGSETDPEWEVNRFHNVCLADFGNGCWTYRQFTDEVQTRQYRSPEVILGDGYSTPIDLWSTACMIFELLTGEFLFDPKARDDYSRDEDHLALMQELLGEMPEHMARGNGKFRAQYFNSAGQLRHIKDLRFVGMSDVLCKRYHFTRKKAREIEEFLVPMLALDPAERFTAQEMLTEFADFFEVQEDDYSPLCYATGGDGEDEEELVEDDVEADEQTLEQWYDSMPLLRPESLAERGLTLEEVKAAVGGRFPEDEDKREAIIQLLDEMQNMQEGDDTLVEEEEEEGEEEAPEGDQEEIE